MMPENSEIQRGQLDIEKPDFSNKKAVYFHDSLSNGVCKKADDRSRRVMCLAP
jgi:hypothetical protein